MIDRDSFEKIMRDLIWRIAIDTHNSAAVRSEAAQRVEQNVLALCRQITRLERDYGDLLAACELVLTYIEDGAPQTAADRLRAAITKARGELSK